MPTRTSTARGRVDNTGNVQGTFRVRLVTDVFLSGTRIGGSNSETNVTLDPGQSSEVVELEHTVNIDGGQQAISQLHLDRLSPEPATDIDKGPTQNYSEPIVVGGRLVTL